MRVFISHAHWARRPHICSNILLWRVWILFLPFNLIPFFILQLDPFWLAMLCFSESNPAEEYTRSLTLGGTMSLSILDGFEPCSVFYIHTHLLQKDDKFFIEKKDNHFLSLDKTLIFTAQIQLQYSKWCQDYDWPYFHDSE